MTFQTKPESLAVDAPHVSHENRLGALVAQAATGAALPTAVVYPCDSLSLSATCESAAECLIEPVLVGPRARIEEVAQQNRLDIGNFEIIDTPDAQAAAERSVALVRDGKAGLLMKGSLHTDDLMRAVVAAQTGLRTNRRISHCFVMDLPSQPRLLVITDAAINIAPTLLVKRDIIQNAIDLARIIGIQTPRVAILSAVETINADMQSTLDAAVLSKMADRGQITGGLVDGPLAFDNAISPDAAKIKGIRSDVAGRADILMVPAIEAGNMLAKELSFASGAEAAGLVVGARVPIILTSRSDSEATRIASVAIGVIAARAAKGS